MLLKTEKVFTTMQYINSTIFFTILFFLTSCSVFLYDKPSKNTVSQLKQSYEVSLGSGWTEEQANRLLVTFDFIYQDSEEPNPNLNPSVWKISNTDLQEDFKIESADNLDHITLRSDIFSIQESHEENAQETILSNQPFFRVVAQFVTEDWTNISVVKQILKDGTDRDRIVLVLKEMYGLSLVRKDTPEANKIGQKLQKYIGELRLSKFKNQELVELMSVYEKFPKGLHKIPKLKYLIRSPQAPYAGSAWIVADCVEYAAATFSIKNENEFQRVILHEKAHFLWEYALNGKLRKEWSDLGGWHKDPNNKFGWAKTKSRREFVTNYAFSKNPNEDWAESVSYYLLHPNKLRSASLDKYEFIELVMLQYTDGDVPFKRLKTLTSTD